MDTAERRFLRRWVWCTALSGCALVAPAAMHALLLAHPGALPPAHATMALAGCLAESICIVPRLYARLFASDDH